jgi:VCBS repeat protein
MKKDATAALPPDLTLVKAFHVAAGALAFVLLGCASGCASGDEECGRGSCDDGDGASGGAGAGGPGSGGGASGPGSGGGPTHPGDCNQLCGQVAAPDPEAGLGSFAPPGCSGGQFQRTYGLLIGDDGSKAVPQLADMDGDGHVDLVLNARKGPSAMIMPGDGTGNFASQPVVLPAGGIFAGGWGIDLGDIDGNGMLDLAAGDHVSGALAWKNQGSMAFALATSGLPAGTFNGVGLAELSGDGHMDAIYGADQFSSGLALVLGDGNGGWTPANAATLTGSAARNSGNFGFADYDTDADLDVFAFGQSSMFGGVIAYVYTNDGGTFTEATQLTGGAGNAIGSPVQGSLADVDCDGVLDVATGGTVHRGTGDGWQPLTTVGPANIAHLGDLDGDGFADLVLHDESNGLVAYHNDNGSFAVMDLGLPDATYVPPGVSGENITPLAQAYGIDLADVNGDEQLDVARVLCAMTSTGFTNKDWCFVEVWVRQ